MPALVAGIYVFFDCKEDVDGRDKPGQDGVPLLSQGQRDQAECAH
jgi:hypothetical protein